MKLNEQITTLVFPKEHNFDIFIAKLTSRAFGKFQKKIKLSPVGIEITTLTITAADACPIVLNKRSLNSILFYAPFHLLDLDHF